MNGVLLALGGSSRKHLDMLLLKYNPDFCRASASFEKRQYWTLPNMHLGLLLPVVAAALVHGQGLGLVVTLRPCYFEHHQDRHPACLVICTFPRCRDAERRDHRKRPSRPSVSRATFTLRLIMIDTMAAARRYMDQLLFKPIQ